VARQSCPVVCLKFATASFLGLPLYSAHILWISVHYFVVTSSPASCVYFIAILWFKSFLIESACVGVPSVCKVVPALAHLLSHFLVVQHGREPTGIWPFSWKPGYIEGLFYVIYLIRENSSKKSPVTYIF